jgi:hypothetical protein
MGAIAIDPSPSKKKTNMAGRNFREAGGAFANSFQRKITQPIPSSHLAPSAASWRKKSLQAAAQSEAF